MKKLITVCIVLLCHALFSQKEKLNAPFSIRGSIGIPRTITSQQFRTCFNGLYEYNISGNLRVSGNFFAGLGYQNTHFQNNKQVFATLRFQKRGQPTGVYQSYNTRLDCHGLFLKLGYDKFFAKGYFTYALNTGFLDCNYKNINDSDDEQNKPWPSLNFLAPYLQPEVSANFHTDGILSFSLLFSYATMFYKFDPKAPRFLHIEQVSFRSTRSGQSVPVKNNYLISWVNIGFGFNVLLGDK